VILGGEGGISPETGIFYPWITDVLAKDYGALVLEPEHRFYGESLPFGNESFTRENLKMMSSQQALADAAHFIKKLGEAYGCTKRGTSTYCPVLTIGGSYPGFLSAMMRLRYPSVVDMAYAASAPMRFYSQQVDQYAYYNRVTSSAERAVPGCADAVLAAFNGFQDVAATWTTQETIDALSICGAAADVDAENLVDNIVFLAEQTFAGLNMENYPPGNTTGLAKTCEMFKVSEPVDAIRNLLLTETQVSVAGSRGRYAKLSTSADCFDLAAQLPAGPNATARCGDWSGCGSGHDGEMWDFQTCTFEVERISYGGPNQMFPNRSWSMDWLDTHCRDRFGVVPQPRGLADLWGIDEADFPAFATRIVFTNGLNDGWSEGGILVSPSPELGLMAFNMKNGAHHSDLSHVLYGEEDTPDVRQVHTNILALVGEWLEEIKFGVRPTVV